MSKGSVVDWFGKELVVLDAFASKKNRVFLVRGQDDEAPVWVLKEFHDPVRADREAEILKILQDHVTVPRLMGQDCGRLLLEFLPGKPLAEWLEAAETAHSDRVSDEARHRLMELATWLKSFYIQLYRATGRTLIMGDMNLRNFLVGDTIAGVDFEDVRVGTVSEDLGAAAAYMLMYAPERTPWKQQLVESWLDIAAREFSLDPEGLSRAMDQELAAMVLRRTKKNS